MKLFVSTSGVASTLLKHFGTIVEEDIVNRPLTSIGYTRFDNVYEDDGLILFLQNTSLPPAHSIAQLDFAGMKEKLNFNIHSEDLFYFEHIKDLLKAIQISKTIYIVKDGEVFIHER